MIHKNNVIVLFLHHFYRFFSAHCQVNLHTILFHHALCNHQVHFHIINNQYLCIRSRYNLNLFLIHHRIILPVLQCLCDFLTDCLIIPDLLNNLNIEDTSLSINTIHGNRSTHKLRQMLTDCKSQTCSLNISIFSGIHLIECTKNIFNIFWFYTNSGVPYIKGNDRF